MTYAHLHRVAVEADRVEQLQALLGQRTQLLVPLLAAEPAGQLGPVGAVVGRDVAVALEVAVRNQLEHAPVPSIGTPRLAQQHKRHLRQRLKPSRTGQR